LKIEKRKHQQKQKNNQPNNDNKKSTLRKTRHRIYLVLASANCSIKITIYFKKGNGDGDELSRR